LRGIELIGLLLSFTALVASLTVHEMARAWTADRLGDSTARRLGRVSFNPLVHVDPVGTLLMPLVAFLSGWPLIGWARPVPVDARALGEPRRDLVLVAAAGPASNLLVAGAAAALLWVAGSRLPGGPFAWPAAALELAVQLNLLLAFFNLVPVPPLDGGTVLGGLLPRALGDGFDRVVRPYGVLVLYALLLTGALDGVVFGPARSLTRVLVP
jgi:Zn-dependent protease